MVGVLVQRRDRQLGDRARARHLRAVPSAFISQNEIDAAKTVHFDYLNAQGQPKFVWPAIVLARRARTSISSSGTAGWRRTRSRRRATRLRQAEKL